MKRVAWNVVHDFPDGGGLGVLATRYAKGSALAFLRLYTQDMLKSGEFKLAGIGSRSRTIRHVATGHQARIRIVKAAQS